MACCEGMYYLSLCTMIQAKYLNNVSQSLTIQIWGNLENNLSSVTNKVMFESAEE